jgi:hypothetical protein
MKYRELTDITISLDQLHILTTSLATANGDCNSNIDVSPFYCCVLVQVQKEQRKTHHPHTLITAINL